MPNLTQTQTVASGEIGAKPLVPAARRILRGYVVSDLHIFARRSRFEQMRETIESAFAGAEVIVLNGDTFDFRWTQRPTIQETVVEAISMLRQWTAQDRRRQIHLVLGNHDHLREFIEQASLLDQAASNFYLHPYHVLLGDNFFLHGDVVDCNGDPAALARQRARCLFDRRKHDSLHYLYDAAIRLGLQKIATLKHPTRSSAAKISAYIERIGLGDEIRNVYFGHTHIAVSNHSHDGFVFHNTGSLIKGLPFQMEKILVRQ